MSKKILEDVRRPEHRSIRSIEVSSDRRKKEFSNESSTPEEEERESAHEPVVRRTQHHRDSYEPSGSSGIGAKFLLWCIVGICVIVLFFVGSSYFSGATVTVTPKHQTATLKSSFVAFKEGTADQLSYKVVTLSKEASQAVDADATGQTAAATKASGQIIVYNNNSTTPQTLIKNTRFATPDGLIYRINQAVSVPGKSATKPGSVTVTVYADQAGSKYNIGLTDFTLPGLQSNPQKYQNIYGRSKTAIGGGTDGGGKTASGSDQQTAIKTMQDSLTSELVREAEAQIPNDYILYPKGIFVSFDQLPAQASQDSSTGVNQVVISERATLNAILLSKSLLSKIIAQSVLASYSDQEPVTVSNLSSLTFAITSNSSQVWTSDSIPFTLSGTPNIAWQYPEDTLKQALAGQPSENVSHILAGFPAIDKADVVISPFWESSFPGKPEKIKVVNKI